MNNNYPNPFNPVTTINYSVTFDGSNLNSGVYYYRLKTGNNVTANKMILMK